MAKSTADPKNPHANHLTLRDIYPAPRDVNTMEGIQAFMLKWQTPDSPGNNDTVTLGLSSYGNINDSGSPRCSSGPSLTPYQPQFELSLEPGICALVLRLVHRFGLITYTSCEGHRYRGLDLTPTERHVGVLPRSDTERTSVERLFVNLATTVNSGPDVNPVVVAVMLHRLADRTASYPAIDLYFARQANAQWDDYFSRLPSLYEETLRYLSREQGLRSIVE